MTRMWKHLISFMTLFELGVVNVRGDVGRDLMDDATGKSGGNRTLWFLSKSKNVCYSESGCGNVLGGLILGVARNPSLKSALSQVHAAGQCPDKLNCSECRVAQESLITGLARNPSLKCGLIALYKEQCDDPDVDALNFDLGDGDDCCEDEDYCAVANCCT